MSIYNQEINQKIGAKIKAIRKSRGITQIDLANSMGISYQQIQKYENGQTRITVERLKQLADIFKISFNILIEEIVTFNRSFLMKEDTESGELFSKDLKSDEMALLKLYRSIRDERIKKGLLWQLKGIHHNQEKSGP